MDNNKLFGVGLLLFRSKESNKFFTVKEKKTKEEILKRAGMISFPLETYKKEDGSFANTLIRLIKEEIGISRDCISNLEVIDQSFNLFPKRPDIYTFYGVAFLKTNEVVPRPSDNNDVEFFGWKEARELKEFPVRAEVWPILEDYYKRI
jgi:8-oxo-dGTP pyrophosphatase MutT (NUDIX family)